MLKLEKPERQPWSGNGWFAGDCLPTGSSSKDFGYRTLVTEIKQLPALADFILQYRFGEPQGKGYRLPGVNAKNPSLFGFNNRRRAAV
jgi:hypothetical protein